MLHPFADQRNGRGHQVFGSPPLTTAGIQVLKRLPFMTDIILKLTHGRAY